MEIERVREIAVETESESLARERASIRKRLRVRKERQRLSGFEKGIVECPECGSRSLEHNDRRGEIVCSECGLVLDEKIIDPGPEWRAFDEDQKNKRARTGPPSTVLIHDKGLSTVIDWRNKDSLGKAISQGDRVKYYKLRRWQRRMRVRNAQERNLAFALSELTRMVSAVGLSKNIHEMAAVIYRRALKQDIIRGRSIEGMVSASLYAACRQANSSRTLDEIADVSRVSTKEVGRTYRVLTQRLKLKLAPSLPMEYVSRFCSKLELPSHIESKVLEELKKERVSGYASNGKNPIGIAATVIYIVARENGFGYRATQRMVAAAADVTEVTIRNNAKILYSEESDVSEAVCAI